MEDGQTSAPRSNPAPGAGAAAGAAASTAEITVYDSMERRGFAAFVVQCVRDMVLFRHGITLLVAHNLARRYRRSYLGFLWGLLNPLLTMAVVSVIFGTLYKADLRSFGVYVFSGLLPWTFLSNSLTFGGEALIQSEGYIRKLRVPKAMFPVVAVTSELVNFVLSLASLFLVVACLRAPVGWGLLGLPVAALLAFTFVLGLALVLSVANVYFRDMPYILQVGLMLAFYTVPILYPVSLLPPQLARLLAFNPFYHFIRLFQCCIHEGTWPPLWQLGLCAGMALLALTLGLYVLMRRDRDMIYRL